ncbi:hypothetical protein H6P81_004928 [Aristolochia fimbriata]|uniref:PUM-HD domain-containing protein n=1 Tax=Aristolochia fimbriata TaxID=158543 RepID=A0AAV7ETQ3_ARIFI|nr:hypothetical protein H6P81_004928 [Aristolochia fimbriata]
MDKGGTDQAFQAIEMLLGDFSDAASSSPHHGEPNPTISSSDFKPISLETANGNSGGITGFYYPSEKTDQSGNTNFYDGVPFERHSSKSHFDQNLQRHGNADAAKVKLKREFQLPVSDGSQDSSTLPDDQSLASAFADLSFKESVPVDPTMSGQLKYNSVPNHAFSLDAQYSNHFRKSFPISDLAGMVVPPSPNTVNSLNLVDPMLEPYPSLASSNGLNKFNLEMNGHERMKLLNHQKSLEHFMGDLVDQRSNPPLISGAPLHQHSGIHAFPVGPTTFPVQGMEFSMPSFQQQVYLDTQSSPCMQQQHLGQAHIGWRHLQDDRYSKMHPNYFYLQQLQNQLSEAHPIQTSGTTPVGSMSRNLRHTYLDASLVDQVQQANQDPYWSNRRGFNYPDLSSLGGGACRFHAQGYCGRECCNLAHGGKQIAGQGFAARDLLGVQVMDKGVGSYFPEKILTRSHGLNSIKLIKPGSVGGPGSLNQGNSNGRSLSNGQYHNPSSGFSSCGSFRLDGRSSCASSPENLDCGLFSRSQPQKYNSVDEVVGRIYQMAKDQHGCRFLQRKFTDGTPEDVQKIFVEIIDHIVELMTDPFGNYLVQKLLEVCDEDQRMQILRSVTRKDKDLIKISCDMHGTRAVQKVIETLKTPEQTSIVVASLKPGIVMLIKDMNGNHVAQRCLQHLMLQYREFLFDAATAHCVELATDRHGCCVLQKCLQNSDGEQSNCLMAEITSNALVLSKDPFGNYVVQFVIEQGIPWAIDNVMEQLEGSYGELSTQKYSSNVVEKCLKHAGEDKAILIIQELINNSEFGQILQDPYGNYVVQSALANSKGVIHSALVEAIRPHIPALRSSPYGKKVLSSNSLKK